ncbi:hypothetical protein IQ215_05770 [Cyanobacterium stanieri LEGE 03274]|uniref:Uncharacterized protein n=1 Tax=Cyanobacterium stanieri LEGE 03274 TaxID=1828756 RepID=A0ABR9V4X5_9CHRO|nr:hypothetical protein [Cyanobacterium stanieri]MBE9222201.1 hypothetical protein [Cyanobacterium stanieri LEGE 03274]
MFKEQPIDLKCEYPCPCRREGKLQPITLTEALGCNECQQIFVTEEEHKYLKPVVDLSPYKKKWSWNGKKWVLHRQGISKNYLLFLVWFTIGITSLSLVFSLISSLPWVLATMMIISSVLIILLLPYRY